MIRFYFFCAMQFKMNFALVIILIFQWSSIFAFKDDENGISTNASLTKYLIWTRSNPDQEQELIFDDLLSVRNSTFDATKLTKVVVHGYTGFGTMGWVNNVKNAFLLKGNQFWRENSNETFLQFSNNVCRVN